jgi:hypothetical protein
MSSRFLKNVDQAHLSLPDEMALDLLRSPHFGDRSIPANDEALTVGHLNLLEFMDRKARLY